MVKTYDSLKTFIIEIVLCVMANFGDYGRPEFLPRYGFSRSPKKM